MSRYLLQSTMKKLWRTFKTKHRTGAVLTKAMNSFKEGRFWRKTKVRTPYICVLQPELFCHKNGTHAILTLPRIPVWLLSALWEKWGKESIFSWEEVTEKHSQFFIFIATHNFPDESKTSSMQIGENVKKVYIVTSFFDEIGKLRKVWHIRYYPMNNELVTQYQMRELSSPFHWFVIM